MKKIVFVVMIIVVVVSTTVQANPPDTLIYNATKSSSSSSLLTKGSTAYITEADSVVVIAIDSINNSKKIAIYANGEVRFTEWVEADYITIPSYKNDSKITIIAIGGDANSSDESQVGLLAIKNNSKITIIPVGGDANSPDEPQVGLLAILSILVVVICGVYGAFRFWK
jgi:phosphotransferase system HPr-like phosphotransfer protein